MARDKSNKDRLSESIADIVDQRSLRKITRSEKLRKESSLIRDPEKLFKMYLRFKGLSNLSQQPTVNLSESRLEKIFRDNGYPTIETPYPTESDWESFIKFWQPEKLDNFFESGISLDGIFLRTRLWKLDANEKRKAIIGLFEHDNHNTFHDIGIKRLPHIAFILPNDIGFAVIFSCMPNAFYIMQEIPIEAQNPEYLSQNKLEPAFLFNSNVLDPSFLRCVNPKFLHLQKTLADIFRIATGINGKSQYSISYLIESKFLTESEAISYIKKEIYRLIPFSERV